MGILLLTTNLSIIPFQSGPSLQAGAELFGDKTMDYILFWWWQKKNQYPEFYQERLPLFGEKYGMIQFQSLKHILFYGILYTQLSLISN